ncbi:WecB/TagA/CpsF family glycosyltransferase [Paraliomyxa miuraensis]|uniref:WecB/TagA/CpsF family glycosyltransferase n=1 Tax=Paraliomyxa miuraensis TaxID=376150 RepID=UPI0022557E2E|nr:WecB/TagA/CpsF family glycosyltransferase [Paraliomyxa miuraensis]MCX4247720.1 WecB/TagA/CpsF family glycosyltransferase [Paraliomyxa miuraensis]
MTADRSAEQGVFAAAQRFGVRTVELEGLPFLDVDAERFVRLVVDESRAGRGGWVITPNTDILRQVHEDRQIHALVASADALVADGMPLIWASHVQRTPLRGGRICGSDLIYSIPAAAARADRSLYLLGGAGDTGDRTKQELQARNPGLRIVGTHSPPFGFEKQPQELEAMRHLLAEAKPDIVFVALSFPKGERLIAQLRDQLRDVLPAAWWIGVGAAFDFVAGAIERAPGWMQQTGTEWVFRMVKDPKRLVRRYLVHDLPYAGVLFADAVRRRLTGPS